MKKIIIAIVLFALVVLSGCSMTIYPSCDIYTKVGIVTDIVSVGLIEEKNMLVNPQILQYRTEEILGYILEIDGGVKMAISGESISDEVIKTGDILYSYDIFDTGTHYLVNPICK